MKPYLATTGTVFALITLAHIVRACLEPSAAKDPVFHALTLLSAGLAVWAWRLLRRSPEV